MENKIYAKIGDVEIGTKEISELLNSLPPEYQNQLKQAGEKALVNEAINSELFYLEGLKNKVEETEEFKTQLEVLKKSLIKGFSVNEVLLEAKVTEEEIQKYYNENKNNFSKPETVNASHILVDTLEEANEILKELNADNFSSIAKEKSKCPSKENGGNLGDFSKGQMVKEFDEKVFTMKEKEISEVVQTQFGYHIILLNKKNEATTRTLEESKAQISNILLTQKQNEKYTEHLKKLKEEYKVEIL